MNIVRVFDFFCTKLVKWQINFWSDNFADKNNFILLKIEFQIPRQSVTSKSKLVHRCLVLASFHMRVRD